jgi:hypothetical protein
MLQLLNEVIKGLPKMIREKPLGEWGSLIVNRRKPHTYRIFTMLGDARICLHRFELCDESDAFRHPHPWPGAFAVLAGHYRQKVWTSSSRQDTPRREAIDMVLSPGSTYAITNPLTWHSVQPIEMEGYEPPGFTNIFPPSAYSVMVNGKPWDEEAAHEAAPTTKGKDLDKMDPTMLSAQLGVFLRLLDPDLKRMEEIHK